MTVTMKDIAKICQVSTATVSKVLSGKDQDVAEGTKEKILQCAKKEGYVMNALARSMKTKDTKTLGILVPDLKNPYYTEICRGAEEKAHEMGYSLFLCNTDNTLEKELQYLQKLMEKQVDGILIIASLARDRHKEEEMKISVPFGVLNNSTYYEGCDVHVVVDNHSGSYEAMKYLIDIGHVRFLYLAGETDLPFNKDRLEGMTQALEEAKLPIASMTIYEAPFTMEGAYLILRERGIPEGTTALLCGNDLMALGAMNWAKDERISIPKELSILGFDNIIFSEITVPKLTTIDQHCPGSGAALVSHLLHKIQGLGKEETHCVLATHLVVRESTGRPPEKVVKNSTLG